MMISYRSGIVETSSFALGCVCVYVLGLVLSDSMQAVKPGFQAVIPALHC